MHSRNTFILLLHDGNGNIHVMIYVLTCLQKRQQGTRNKETMLVSHTVGRGNMTILAINMYDVYSRK